jgi:hypothetical protein
VVLLEEVAAQMLLRRLLEAPVVAAGDAVVLQRMDLLGLPDKEMQVATVLLLRHQTQAEATAVAVAVRFQRAVTLLRV